QAQREADEVLLDGRDARPARGVELRLGGRRRAGARRGRRLRRILDQLVAAEPGGRRPALLRRNLVLADVLVRQLAIDLEFDRDEVLAADLPRPSGGGEALDAGDLLLAAERLACSREHFRRIGRGRLRGGDRRGGARRGNETTDDTHRSAPRGLDAVLS